MSNQVSLLDCRDSDSVGRSDLVEKVRGVLDTDDVPYVPIERPGQENLLVHRGDRVVSMLDLQDDVLTRVATAIDQQKSPVVSVGSVLAMEPEVERDPKHEAQHVKDVVSIVLPCLKAQVDEIFSDKNRNAAVTELLTKGIVNLKISLPEISEIDRANGKGFSFSRTPTGGDQRYAKDETFRETRNSWFASKVMPILAEELKRYFGETVASKVKGKAYVIANYHTPDGVGVYNYKLLEGDREMLIKALDSQAPSTQTPNVAPYNNEQFVNTSWERDVQKWLQHDGFNVFHNGSVYALSKGRSDGKRFVFAPTDDDNHTFCIAWASNKRKDFVISGGCASTVFLEK